MQKPQHKVAVSRSVAEATEGILNILHNLTEKSILSTVFMWLSTSLPIASK